MPKLTVTVITRNEAADIGDALASVAWADEIVVVDSCSSDATVEIARRHTNRVFVREWPGYIAQKNFAASQASNDWIFSLDGDERVTPELAAEIRKLLATDPTDAGYRVPRVSWYLGQWVRTTDWFPDYQLRLFDRRRGEWTGRYVHETLSVRGSVGRLSGELQHYAYRDISEHLETIDRYSTYAAQQMFEDGKRTNAAQLALHPPFAFLRNFLLRGGFRDGSAGLVISALNSYYVFLKFAKLWEIQRTPPAPGPSAPER